MNPIDWMRRRTRALFGRRALERDMKEELRAHLEHAEERLRARGMSAGDARAAAQREFGNVAAIEEDARDARGSRFMESLVADIRFAFRYFARKPLSTVTIVLVLALGIGVNTALFSVIQAFTMRPAAGVPKDDAHVRVWGLEQPTKGARWAVRDLSYPELEALSERKDVFAALAGWTSDEVVIEARAAEAAIVRGVYAEFVTPNYWTVLGVRPIAGPGFAAPRPGVADLAAVISFALSEELFPSPAEAIGKLVVVNEIPVRIVGVAPRRFEGAVRDNGRPQLWLPMSARTDVAHGSTSWQNESRIQVFGRIAPSVDHEQATAVARDVIARMLPDSSAHAGVVRNGQVQSLHSPPPAAYEDEIVGVAALTFVALLILLVACSNVSSLMVAGAVSRRHEIAVRLSLGASRSRVLRQLLTESALLALSGGAAGLLVCWWITTLIAKRENIDIVPDLGTIVFTMVFALGTGLLFGLSPALHATRSGVSHALRDSGGGATRQSRLQRTFVISQIVFSQPLLVLIAVVLATIIKERPSLPEVAVDRLITVRFRPLTETGALSQRREAVDALRARIAAEPAVDGVLPEPAAFAIATAVVPSADAGADSAKGAVIPLRFEGTAPGYFALQNIPIVLGRDVALSDTNAAEYPIVIGSDLARTLWGNENPIGKSLPTTDWKAGAQDSAGLVVVGVFDASFATTRGGGKRIYTARGTKWRRDALLVRTRGPAVAYVPTLQKFILSNAPGLPVTRLATLLDIRRESRREAVQIFAATVSAGALALLLASIGLFAVISLAVSQRKREIGIRIALGAEPLRVAVMFFRSGLRMSVMGLLIGLPISVAAIHVAMTQGIVLAPEFNLPAVGVGIAFVVLCVAAAATWFPARKAASVDPSLALRAE